MPQLSKSVVSETKLIIREGLVNIKRLLSSDSDFKLMFSARVGYNLPVMDAIKEGPIGRDGSKVVIGFV